MTGNNYSNKKIKNQHLKNIYKKYTDHIISLEKHIIKIFDEWIIDINTRNRILQKIDNLVKIMIKIYNNNLVQIHNKDYDTEDSEIDENKISSAPNIGEIIDNSIKIIEILQNPEYNKDNPFHEIKFELIELAKENGIQNMSEFLKLYTNDKYIYLLDASILEIFDLYDKVFIPLGITIKKNKKNINRIDVKKNESTCDGLIDNTCFITIYIGSMSLKIVFDGYISTDILNIYVRSSQIYSKYLYNIRSNAYEIIKNDYPQIDSGFLSRYTKLANSCYYFINNADSLSKKIATDYFMLEELNNKNPNIIIKEFTSTDIKYMFKMINILLMGNNQNISIAVLLFNLLKGGKIGGETLSDIIYHNLSFYSQVKLKKGITTIKNELERIKAITPDNISIEKRLASQINMPDTVKSYILEKINEIKTGENNYKLQMAVNGLLQFPWKPKDSKNIYSDIKKSMAKSRKYLQNVAKKLDQNVYGHENSKKVLIELVGKWIQNPDSTGQVIGLVGPPGIGKTLLAKSISSALDIPLSIVGLGGMSDSADLIGHSFTYSGAQYGMIIRQMIKAGNWRSVMFFDEVDKVSKRNDTNEIYNTLIHITDPNMNQHFQDRFYSSSIEFDLSGVLIVFSYNDSSKLDPILLDRIKEIHIPAYSIQEKISIVQNYVLKELCENIAFDRNKIHFSDETVRYIIEKYTLEAGVRELRRKLEQILLKLNIDRFYMRGPFRSIMNKKFLEITDDSEKYAELNDNSEGKYDKKNGLIAYVEYKKSKVEELLTSSILNEIFNLDFNDQIIIDNIMVHRYLEKPVLLSEEIHRNDLIGVINGLYATNIGMGGIIPIQIYKNYIGDSNDKSNIKLKLTGNQQKVMRESVICALTTAVNILNSDIRNNITKNFPYGFHIHAPDGGTPKDGPSAGCAFATAFVSVLLGKKINRNIAMTGEIELTGKISKIGGLVAKLTGAKKAGVKYVYICEENREDFEIIKKKSPEMFNNDFQIKIVKHIIDIVIDPNVIIGIDENDFDPTILKEYQYASNKFNIDI